MGKDKQKKHKVIPRVPKGMRDLTPDQVRNRVNMINTIRKVYELHGFVPLETPLIEYVDCLGKYLPEADEPSEGIFAFKYDDDQWVATRYDLTAPLARYFSEHEQQLPTPFRRYQVGTVLRNEQVKKGRFREFVQFDIDTVGSSNMLADTEIIQTICEAMEKLGFSSSQYQVLVSNRKIANGLLELAGITESRQVLTVLRAIDKIDRLGIDGAVALLGQGRKDESGVFTKGAGLDQSQIDTFMNFIAGKDGREETLALFAEAVAGSKIGEQGVDELRQIHEHLNTLGMGADRVVFSPRIVRGLEYYTGPVFEIELLPTFEDPKTGETVSLGSIGAGGRYDTLVKYFTRRDIPATGASIGVDRLLFAMERLGLFDAPKPPPVLITVMDKQRIADYQKMAKDLREAGIRAEIFVGGGKFSKQMKYADQRNCIIVVIAGEDEFARGEVTLKDLIVGRELAKDIADRDQWLSDQPSQETVRREDMIEKIKEINARHSGRTE